MSQFSVNEHEPDYSAQLGVFPDFEAAEAYVLKCMELHDLRRQLELKYFPKDQVIAPEYKRVAPDRWEAGHSGYTIQPSAPENDDPAKQHLKHLRFHANEEDIAEYGKILHEMEREAEAQRAELTARTIRGSLNVTP